MRARRDPWGNGSAIFSKIRFEDLTPVAPAIAEPSTGESMGQSAEKMAKENGISREEQDRIALLSHQRASAATQDGRLGREIAPWFGGRAMDQIVTTDNLIRADTSLEALAKLKPVFDKRYGSVTAGNSSPLTDGAAVTLLMEESKARSLGYQPLAAVRSYAVAAVDPGWQLLMGPVWAVPKALDRAGISWKRSGPGRNPRGIRGAGTVQCAGLGIAGLGGAARSQGSGGTGRLGSDQCDGGSIAIGHPFGATGARLATSLANEMRRRDVEFGLISICAQGGMGFAMVLQNVR